MPLSTSEAQIISDIVRAAAHLAKVDRASFLLRYGEVTPWRCAAMAYAVSEFGFSQEEVGEAFSRSKATVHMAVQLMGEGRLSAELKALDAEFKDWDQRRRPRPKVAPFPPGAEKPGADLKRLKLRYPEWRV